VRAEIIGVGTELLLGQIADTNAQYLSQALNEIGVGVYWHTAVGDNLGRIVEAVDIARSRCDVVVMTGGLGPTPDDITREAVAKALGVPLKSDPRLLEQVRAAFERMGRKMPAHNERQALIPEGATPIAPQGTAPGFYIESDGKILFALPGVPWEMKAMVKDTLVPVLSERAGSGSIVSRQIIVIGPGESRTHEMIEDIVDAQTNPTIAFLASGGQVRVRITARAATHEEAAALIEPVERKVRERLGEHAVVGDALTLAEGLSILCRSRGLTLAVSESLTGGLIGAELSEAPGASEFFLGSLVVYATEAKARIAGVDEKVLDGPGPVSEEAARALAEAAAHRFGADVGVAATGVAGPTEQDGKPVGLVYVACHLDGKTEVRELRAPGSREHIRQFATTVAIDLARRTITRHR
jgi:nicotinamide-nucleotide amidase